MRKLLISIVLILLIVMTALCIRNGINIGPLHVLGISQIQEANNRLNSTISEAQNANSNYENKLTQLKTEISDLISAKEECLQLINVSTESQLQEATQTKNYTIEYLWSQIGNHATREGVVIQIDVVSGTIVETDYRDLNFTVSGNYLAITNFITELENDDTLQFTIDDFSMTQNHATFTVKNVKIDSASTAASSQSSTSTSNTNTSSNASLSANSNTNTASNNTTTNGTANNNTVQ